MQSIEERPGYAEIERRIRFTIWDILGHNTSAEVVHNLSSNIVSRLDDLSKDECGYRKIIRFFTGYENG
jgi:hypothetical protein